MQVLFPCLLLGSPDDKDRGTVVQHFSSSGGKQRRALRHRDVAVKGETIKGGRRHTEMQKSTERERREVGKACVTQWGGARRQKGLWGSAGVS